MFKGAYEKGTRFVYDQMKTGQYDLNNLTDIIFLALQENPYKSVEVRNNFIQGVSDQVNWSGRMLTRRMVYAEGICYRYGRDQ